MRDQVDPLAGEPGDDVGVRGDHPVAALDRDDPAAGWDGAGKPLQRGRYEIVLAGDQYLHRNGGLWQPRRGDRIGAGMFARYRLSPLR